jgi:excisionase family DNA binding protein
MEEDLSKWLTIGDAVAQSKRGQRTIERMIQRHEIRTAKYKKYADKKPIVVIDPAELPKLQAETLRPTVEPQPATVPTRQHDRLPAKASLRQPDTRAILKALEQLRMPLAQKVYLTVQEAASYLGFPQSEVKRLIDTETIPSIRLSNGWRRIARKDLDHYTPPSVGLTEWRNGKEESTAM